MISSKRLNFWNEFLRPVANIVVKKYHPTANFHIDEKDGCVIISNHQTLGDQYFISTLTKQKIYWMVSADVIQRPFFGKLLMHLFRLIIKEKGNTTDLRPIKECIQLSKENQIVAIFPEGNRSLDGKLCYVDKSIAKLLKMMKKPVYIININGYQAEPRWSDKLRKTSVDVKLRKVISIDELEKYDLDQLYDQIVENLTIKEKKIAGTNNRQAERFERVAFICPVCHHVHTIYSKKDYIYCSNCHLKVKINQFNEFESDNPEFKFKTIPEWYNYQIEQLKHTNFNDEIIYQDENIIYEEPRNYKKPKRITKGKLLMYKDRFVLIDKKNKQYEIKFTDINDISLVANTKLLIHVNNKTFIYHGNKTFNSLKYMLTYYIIQYKNGNNPDLYLGI